MSVAQILEQMAENAARVRLQRGAILGDTIAGLSHLPLQISADRQQQADRARRLAQQAAQAGYARNADARATADQNTQDAAARQAIETRAHLQAAIKAGFGDSTDPKDFSVANAAKWLTDNGRGDLVPTVVDVHDKMQPKLTSGAPGSVLRGPDGRVVPDSEIPIKKPDYTIGNQRFSGEGAPIGEPVPAPATHSASFKEWQDYKSQGGPLDYNAYQTADANRKKPVINVSGMGALYDAVDPKAIAAQIRAAQHPPDISQYGRPAAAAIASELAKRGPNGEAPFNLSSAQREWMAQKRLNSTMNGAQQVRLDESIRSGLAMYDKIDELATQWDGLGIGPLSRVNLAAARNGLKGQKAASLANQLTGQIGQLTSDVATIEQGGLTPTNESRAIAEKSLQDWWSKGTIHDMTAQGRYNMQIRHTARETQVPMVPGNGINTEPARPATPRKRIIYGMDGKPIG